jgi:hypothetical protein
METGRSADRGRVARRFHERGCAARAQCPSWAIESSATVTAKISTSF